MARVGISRESACCRLCRRRHNRDTFAVDLLVRGATPYDVAKMLGDKVHTVEKHYAPFVKELRERVRRLMDNGEGIEKAHCTNIAQQPALKGRIQ